MAPMGRLREPQPRDTSPAAEADGAMGRVERVARQLHCSGSPGQGTGASGSGNTDGEGAQPRAELLAGGLYPAGRVPLARAEAALVVADGSAGVAPSVCSTGTAVPWDGLLRRSSVASSSGGSPAHSSVQSTFHRRTTLNPSDCVGQDAKPQSPRVRAEGFTVAESSSSPTSPSPSPLSRAPSVGGSLSRTLSELSLQGDTRVAEPGALREEPPLDEEPAAAAAAAVGQLVLLPGKRALASRRSEQPRASEQSSPPGSPTASKRPAPVPIPTSSPFTAHRHMQHKSPGGRDFPSFSSMSPLNPAHPFHARAASVSPQSDCSPSPGRTPFGRSPSRSPFTRSPSELSRLLLGSFEQSLIVGRAPPPRI